MPKYSKLQRSILLNTVCIAALLPLAGCNSVGNFLTGKKEKVQVVDGPRRVPQGNQQAAVMQTQLSAPVAPVAPQAAQLSAPPAPLPPAPPTRYEAPMVETVPTTRPAEAFAAPEQPQQGFFDRMFGHQPAPEEPVDMPPEQLPEAQPRAAISGTLPSPRILSGERKGFPMNPNNPDAGTAAVNVSDASQGENFNEIPAPVTTSPQTAPATAAARESWTDRMWQTMKTNGDEVEARDAANKPQATLLNQAEESPQAMAEPANVPVALAASPVTLAPDAPTEAAEKAPMQSQMAMAQTANPIVDPSESKFPSLSSVPETPATFGEMKDKRDETEQDLQTERKQAIAERSALMAEPSEMTASAPDAMQPQPVLLGQASRDLTTPPPLANSMLDDKRQVALGDDTIKKAPASPVTLSNHTTLPKSATQLVPPVADTTFSASAEDTPAAAVPAAETAASLGNENAADTAIQQQAPAPAVKIDAIPVEVQPESAPAPEPKKPAPKKPAPSVKAKAKPVATQPAAKVEPVTTKTLEEKKLTQTKTMETEKFPPSVEMPIKPSNPVLEPLPFATQPVTLIGPEGEAAETVPPASDAEAAQAELSAPAVQSLPNPELMQIIGKSGDNEPAAPASPGVNALPSPAVLRNAGALPPPPPAPAPQ